MSSPAQTNPSSGGESRPPQVMPVSVLAESELGSEAQRERRKRILDATLAIASKGGYEAVQMRAVAERAEVALGTLYRYFPSKVHLLVSALGRTFAQLQDSVPTSGENSAPGERVYRVVAHVTRFLAKNRRLSGAMVRALMSAEADA